MTTIIGLTTAGLTVALKDFIVAFFGWFALMGKNGMRIGDWVEIEGVGGEVIEIGLLKTVLLEMGNWANTGHPTAGAYETAMQIRETVERATEADVAPVSSDRGSHSQAGGAGGRVAIKWCACQR